jgi:hypothetical protein
VTDGEDGRGRSLAVPGRHLRIYGSRPMSAGDGGCRSGTVKVPAVQPSFLCSDGTDGCGAVPSVLARSRTGRLRTLTEPCHHLQLYVETMCKHIGHIEERFAGPRIVKRSAGSVGGLRIAYVLMQLLDVKRQRPIRVDIILADRYR